MKSRSFFALLTIVAVVIFLIAPTDYFYLDYSSPDFFQHTFLINRYNRNDRLLESVEMFDILGINVNLVEAYDKDSDFVVRVQQQIADANNGTMRPRAEIAVFASHVGVYRKIVAERIPAAVIFEDDADTTLDSFQRAKGLLQNFSPKYWDMLYLGNCFEADSPDILLSGNGYVIQKSVKPCCFHAYAVSLVGAERLLTQMPSIFDISATVDYTAQLFIERGQLTSYSCMPIIFHQNDGKNSDIGGTSHIFQNPADSLRNSIRKKKKIIL